MCLFNYFRMWLFVLWRLEQSFTILLSAIVQLNSVQVKSKNMDAIIDVYLSYVFQGKYHIHVFHVAYLMYYQMSNEYDFNDKV